MRKTFRFELGVEARVLKLARFGLSVAEISKRLKLGTRIIEHILNSPTANGAPVLPPLPLKRVE
jgi:transposase